MDSPFANLVDKGSDWLHSLPMVLDTIPHKFSHGMCIV